jgi:hypothetical protein
MTVQVFEDLSGLGELLNNFLHLHSNYSFFFFKSV